MNNSKFFFGILRILLNFLKFQIKKIKLQTILIQDDESKNNTTYHANEFFEVDVKSTFFLYFPPFRYAKKSSDLECPLKYRFLLSDSFHLPSNFLFRGFTVSFLSVVIQPIE